MSSQARDIIVLIVTTALGWFLNEVRNWNVRRRATIEAERIASDRALTLHQIDNELWPVTEHWLLNTPEGKLATIRTAVLRHLLAIDNALKVRTMQVLNADERVLIGGARGQALEARRLTDPSWPNAPATPGDGGTDGNT
jgi:hypothetical protein